MLKQNSDPTFPDKSIVSLDIDYRSIAWPGWEICSQFVWEQKIKIPRKTRRFPRKNRPVKTTHYCSAVCLYMHGSLAICPASLFSTNCGKVAMHNTGTHPHTFFSRVQSDGRLIHPFSFLFILQHMTGVSNKTQDSVRSTLLCPRHCHPVGCDALNVEVWCTISTFPSSDAQSSRCSGLLYVIRCNGLGNFVTCARGSRSFTISHWRARTFSQGISLERFVL